MMLGVLRRVEQRGAVDAAHTLRKNAGQVFRYGIQTGRCERNPVPDLQDALKSLSVKHMAALLELVKVGELMRAIDAYTGQPVTRGALLLSALLFQRPVAMRGECHVADALHDGLAGLHGVVLADDNAGPEGRLIGFVAAGTHAGGAHIAAVVGVLELIPVKALHMGAVASLSFTVALDQHDRQIADLGKCAHAPGSGGLAGLT